MIYFDEAECVIVHADDAVAFDEVGSDDCVVNAHSEIISDGQKGEVNVFVFANQFHVVGKCCVTGIIEITV